MGRIIVTEFLSVDGVMEAPGPRDIEDFKYKGWLFDFDRGAEGDEFKRQENANTAALLLGRVTYETFAAVWPGMVGQSGLAGEIADKFRAVPKYVISSTLDEVSWENSTVLGGGVAAEVSKLRRDIDGDIVVHGSGQLVQALFEHDLVDELRQMIYPVILGSGRRMFGGTSDKKVMELVEAKPVGDGVLILVYRHRDGGRRAEGQG